uniref:Exodeoxyribonuclease X-like C-terminal domain-containing protein n=1 Tax=Globisporangium ultimum (strain ATCC 200006 / CBS 805.95 / DAOM BR144) TaxID=431595 RepID=K3WHA0_GLOUD
MSNILDFGKYKGQSIEEVFEKDASYCCWLYKQEALLESDSPMKAFLEGKIRSDDDSYIMKWGKHKNKTVKWIYENDKKYFEWLLNNNYVSSKCPSLKKDLLKLTEDVEPAA